MRPDEQNSGQGGNPLSNQRPISDVSTDRSTLSPQQAAAQAIRAQIDNIYSNQSGTTNSKPAAQPASQPQPQPQPVTNPKQPEYVSPYQRTHVEHAKPQASQWRQYHSAWQDYYQKYYEGYYTHHLQKAKKELESQNIDEATAKQDAMFELRQQIVNKIGQQGKKIKKSRHFVPILSGIFTVLVFAFLQYNQIIFGNIAAYVSPGTIDAQNIVVNPNQAITVGPEPLLIIPKINVNVPVKYDVGNDYNSQMAAMTTGLAHFAVPGASSHPGQVGNTVIAGHSSNDLLEAGDYKFIFAQLEKLEAGDTIYANYQSVRYTYLVTKKEVVSPDNVSALVYATTKPILTLLTCTPVGTSQNRLLVTAEQTSPDPDLATTAPDTNTGTVKVNSIPGNSPTILERLFGAN